MTPHLHRSRPAERLVAITAALAVILTGCGSPSPSSTPPAQSAPPGATSTSSTAPTAAASSLDPTTAYLAQLDLDVIIRSAADYAHPARPSGDPAAAVAAMQAQLRGVDRVAVLKDVFARLTAGIAAETQLARDTKKELAVLAFVQQLSVHDFASPYMGLPIFDPLVQFEVHAMDCQKDSRLIADLFSAAGYPSRIVDFYGHAVAEVKYVDTWHYADADMFGGGDIVTMPDGHIPSVAELSADPTLLDRLPVYLENEVLTTYPGEAGKNGAAPVREYPSYAYFSAEYFAKQPGYPAYISRTVFPTSAPDPDMTFGWNDPATLTRTDATDIRQSPIPERQSPGPPAIESVSASRGVIRVTVAPSGDAAVTAYRVMVGSKSRGWDYGAFLGSSAAAGSWANPGGWVPEMYPHLFSLPPATAADDSSRGPLITVSGLRSGTYFVSVSALDAYGQQVGRTLYPASNELRVVVVG
jgi:hypothetical protein